MNLHSEETAEVTVRDACSHLGVRSTTGGANWERLWGLPFYTGPTLSPAFLLSIAFYFLRSPFSCLALANEKYEVNMKEGIMITRSHKPT